MSDASALARVLRQRAELGAPSFFFSGLDREAALRLADAGLTTRLQRPTPPAASAVSAPPASSPRSAVSAPPVPPPQTAPGLRPAPDAPSAPPSSATETVVEVESPTAAPLNTDEMTIEALRDAVAVCTRCGLSSTRSQAVFADGHPNARVMVVGEAPGANEDRTGLPFVGAAGKLLDLMLAAVDLSRQESVYICNVIKCRPPGNRNPSAEEISTCAPYLRRQIELVKPEVILAVGTFAGQLLTGRADTALGKLRGEVHSYEGLPLVVTYHPAALLRNGGWKRPTWDDLQLLRRVLEGS